MNRLRDIRTSKKMNQADLARLLNVSSMTISRYESGGSEIDSATICRLCDVFDCSADYLLGRSDIPKTDLTDEELRLLVAFRRSDERARGLVELALAPFVQENGSSATA